MLGSIGAEDIEERFVSHFFSESVNGQRSTLINLGVKESVGSGLTNGILRAVALNDFSARAK